MEVYPWFHGLLGRMEADKILIETSKACDGINIFIWFFIYYIGHAFNT